VLLAKDLSVKLEVIIAENLVAILAGKAVRMEFLLYFRLEILPFDAPITCLTQRVVEFVVVLCAIRVVLDNIKICRLERLFACLTHKTLFVISPSQSTIC